MNTNPSQPTRHWPSLRRVSLSLVLYLLSLSAAAAPSPTAIAFGSCLRQWKPQPIWNAITSLRPNLFLFLGDNVYADTTEPDTMRRAYEELGSQEGFRRLRETCPIHATWDDHDYGANDAGADYPIRETSQEIFLDFFDVPPDAPQRTRPGIYSVHFYGPPERRLQIILLDTRYFRSPLKPAPTTAECPRVNHAPNTDPDATILGLDQWRWLAGQLRRPARVRMIASSIQVIPDEHCFEKWANFPHERERLFQTIRQSGASGVVLISGDRHLAEISRLEGAVGYPLYEITSSGMNSGGAGEGEGNRHRLTADNFRGDNFGLIQIDWESRIPSLRLQIHDVDGRVVLHHDVPLQALDSPGTRADPLPGTGQIDALPVEGMHRAGD